MLPHFQKNKFYSLVCVVCGMYTYAPGHVCRYCVCVCIMCMWWYVDLHVCVWCVYICSRAKVYMCMCVVCTHKLQSTYVDLYICVVVRTHMLQGTNVCVCVWCVHIMLKHIYVDSVNNFESGSSFHFAEAESLVSAVLDTSGQLALKLSGNPPASSSHLTISMKGFQMCAITAGSLYELLGSEHVRFVGQVLLPLNPLPNSSPVLNQILQ